MLNASVLATLLSLLRLVQAGSTDKSEIFVAKCRAQCSRNLTPDGSRATCLSQEECLRCWASCQAFQRDFYIREYCKLNKACSAGCRQACDFYLTSSNGRGAPPAPSQLAAEQEDGGSGSTVLSKQPSPAQDRLPWPADSLPATKTRPSRLQEHKRRWRLRLAGLQPSSPLVSATLTWRSRGQGALYLVTWELKSGGLRGHLVSSDARVSLSLWPDEDYVVQVFSGDESSEPLYVSTKESPPGARALRAWRWALLVLALLLCCPALVLAGSCLCRWLERRRRRRAERLLSTEDGPATSPSNGRTVRSVLRPPAKALEAARLAPVYVISHAWW